MNAWKTGPVCFVLSCLLCGSSAVAGSLPDLGDPPPAPPPGRLPPPSPVRLQSSTPGLSVDITSREAVRNFYNAVYFASENASMGWTGNQTNCDDGTTTASFKAAVALRINFFRAMAGIPANITFDDQNNLKAQEAALMMSVNDQLDHFPPTNWICYTAVGAAAAGNSDLALGESGPDAITGYIEDFGANNAVVGHRRWILYPQTQVMGTGDVPAVDPYASANATWVFDSNFGGPRPTVRDSFVSWPPPGYVPYPLVYPRWSIAYPNAVFTNATVTMTHDGTNVPVTIDPVVTGFGENTLVWHPTDLQTTNSYHWPRPSTDSVYQVQVGQVTVAGQPKSFNYSVTVFDPSVPGPDTVLPALTGPGTLALGQSGTYTFPAVPAADSYQWRMAAAALLNDIEGAENGEGSFVTNISPGYPLTVAKPYEGAWAFHLVQPVPTDQYLTYGRLLAAQTNSVLYFYSELGWATASQQAAVQVSLDDGQSWSDVWDEPGRDDPSSPGEQVYTLHTVSLGAFAGRTVRIRFAYEYLGGTYYPQIDADVGWLLDNIQFANFQELLNPTVAATATDSQFTFTPGATNTVLLQARGLVQQQYPIEWGPVTSVNVTPPLPILRFVGPPVLSSSTVQFDVAVTNGTTGMTLTLESAPAVTGPWATDNNAVVQVVTPGSSYQITTTRSANAQAFYRLTGQ